MTSKRLFAIVVGALFVFALSAGSVTVACDKQAKPAAEVAADKSGCAKKAVAEVAANGNAAEAKPCAGKADGDCCAKKAAAQVAANGNAAEAKPCAGKAEGEGCAKKNAARIAEAKPAEGEERVRNEAP